MNFAKFLRTPFLQNTSRRLLLDVAKTAKLCKSRITRKTYFVDCVDKP